MEVSIHLECKTHPHWPRSPNSWNAASSIISSSDKGPLQKPTLRSTVLFHIFNCRSALRITELQSSLTLKSLILCRKQNPLLSSKQKKHIPCLLNHIKFQWQEYPREAKHSLSPGTSHKHSGYVKLTAIVAAETQTPRGAKPSFLTIQHQTGHCTAS